MRPKVDQRAYNEVCDLWEISERERADPRVRAVVVKSFTYGRRAVGLAILDLRDECLKHSGYLVGSFLGVFLAALVLFVFSLVSNRL